MNHPTSFPLNKRLSLQTNFMFKTNEPVKKTKGDLPINLLLKSTQNTRSKSAQNSRNKSELKAIKVMKEIVNLRFKNDFYQKINFSNKELETELDNIYKKNKTLKMTSRKKSQRRGSGFSKEAMTVQELQAHFTELTVELEDKRNSLDGLRHFSSKLVAELSKHLKNYEVINEPPILTHRDTTHKELSLSDEDNKDPDKLPNFFQVPPHQPPRCLKVTHHVKKDPELSIVNRKHSSLPLVVKVSTTAFKKPEKLKHENIKIIQSENFSHLQKSYQKIPNKHILGKLDPHYKTNTKKEESGEEASVNSDINSSMLDELDDIVDKDLIETKQKDQKPQRNFTTLKISFKIETRINTAQNLVDKTAQNLKPLSIKKDRIHLSFHLQEIEFHLSKNTLVGVRLIFYDSKDGVLFTGEFHGIKGEVSQRIIFQKGELIKKVHFASDDFAIHHIEILTTLNKSFLVGKNLEEVTFMGLMIVNRYFSEKDILYNFFAAFNKKTQKIEFIRFLFVRKNMIHTTEKSSN